METTIEDNVFMARLCEQTERFGDMFEYLKIVFEQKGGEMSVNERNLISVACKSLIGSKRVAWRTVTSVMQNTKYKDYMDSMKDYKNKLENDMYKECIMIVQTIDQFVIKKKGATDEARVFFMKMIADNYRYISEMSKGERNTKAIEEAKKVYEEA